MSYEKEWEDLVKACAHKNIVVDTEFGIIDFSEDAMKDIVRGEHLSYEEYIQALFNSKDDQRRSFMYCFYDAIDCNFNGRISRIDNKNGKVLFERINVSAIRMNGTGYDGKEDHVWMEVAPFKDFKKGDALRFGAEVYRYLKTKKGLQISYGLRNPFCIEKVEDYTIPSDDDMLRQSIDGMICEVCMFNKHCYMGECIANTEWREEMRKWLFEATKRYK